MKFKIVGSHLCPVTLYTMMKCKERGLAFQFVDVLASHRDLKEFLAMHEHDAIYEEFRKESGNPDYIEKGRIGFPCFVFEDGTKTLDFDEAMKKVAEE